MSANITIGGGVFTGSTDDFLSEPPYHFTGVLIRDFPVPANWEKLKRLCDRISPRGGLNEWLPVTNGVRLLVVDYERITDRNSNTGYCQQRELAVQVDVRRGIDNGLYCPLIVVDNPLSMVSGREILGFPKVLGSFTWARKDTWYPITVRTWGFRRYGPDQILEPDLELLRFEPDDAAGNEIGNASGSASAAGDITPLWPMGPQRSHFDGEQAPFTWHSSVIRPEPAAIGAASDIAVPSTAAIQYLNVPEASADGVEQHLEAYARYTGIILRDSGILPPCTLTIQRLASLDLIEALGLAVDSNGQIRIPMPSWRLVDFELTAPTFE